MNSSNLTYVGEYGISYFIRGEDVIEKRPEDFTIEMGPMGAIGEAGALFLRINRNCPWNRCLFCPVYKEKKFGARTLQDLRGDIDTIERIRHLLATTSQEIALKGRIDRNVVWETITRHPEIYGQYPAHVTREQWSAFQILNHVSNWLISGARRVFLQDANVPAMKPGDLAMVLRYLKHVFPTIDTITCYARSKTCARRSVEELKALKEAGLSSCFVGIESGCDEVLETMKKGVTMKEHIEAGQKIMAAGIRMAAFVMPGLAGKNKDLAQKHIADTIKVLNEVRPTEVRVRSLAILEGTQLYERWETGVFQAAGEDQLTEEIHMLAEGLTFDCTFETLQMTNPLFITKGALSEIRPAMAELIDHYRGFSPIDRARILLRSYLDGGYLACVKAWGKYDAHLEQLIEDARASLAQGSEAAPEKTQRAIFAIKSKGVP
jgi:histone acetyltransferase (RNA polymerase elongator complex component)